MKFIPYARQFVDSKDIEAVVKTLRSPWLTQGPQVEAFERAVAEKVSARYAVAVANGTAALHCACFAAGVKKDDEVITSPITFVASGNGALYLGAKIKFADIDPVTYCLDPKRLKSAITPRTKAIIAVDFAGQPCDMVEINSIAKKHRLLVIEDAAHALGATYRRKPVGSLVDMTIFSFHPAKHITTGEGGMVTTDNLTLAERLKIFRTHGITNRLEKMTLKTQASDNEGFYKSGKNSKAAWYYEMQDLGFNYRLSDIHCALGLSQLSKLNGFLKRRREIAAYYDQRFQESPLLIIPHVKKDRKSARHLYVLRLRLDKLRKSRRQIFEELRKKNVGVHVHYIPLHLQPYYRENFGYRRGDFPLAESYYDSALTVPLFPSMSRRDYTYVADSILETVR